MCGIHEGSCLSVEGGHACGIVGAATGADDGGALRHVEPSVVKRARICIEAKGEHFKHLLQQ
jgi:hypothetical protein